MTYAAGVRFKNNLLYPPIISPEITPISVTVVMLEGKNAQFIIPMNMRLGDLFIEVMKALNLSTQTGVFDLLHNRVSLADFDFEITLDKLNWGNPIDLSGMDLVFNRS